MITIKRSPRLWMILSNTTQSKWKHRLNPEHPFLVLDFDRKRVTTTKTAKEGYFESEGTEGWESVKWICRLINDTK